MECTILFTWVKYLQQIVQGFKENHFILVLLWFKDKHEFRMTKNIIPIKYMNYFILLFVLRVKFVIMACDIFYNWLEKPFKSCCSKKVCIIYLQKLCYEKVHRSISLPPPLPPPENPKIGKNYLKRPKMVWNDDFYV